MMKRLLKKHNILLQCIAACVLINVFFFLFFTGGKDQHGNAKTNRLFKAIEAAPLGYKAIFMFASSVCPPGFVDPYAAGLGTAGDWDGRYPLLVDTPSDTTANGAQRPATIAPKGTAPNEIGLGGNSVMTIAQMPSHTHGVVPEAIGDADRGSSGSNFSLDSFGNTSSTGSSQPYWPKFVKLKPCVWQDI